jgi:hypothetical protein
MDVLLREFHQLGCDGEILWAILLSLRHPLYVYLRFDSRRCVEIDSGCVDWMLPDFWRLKLIQLRQFDFKWSQLLYGCE